MGGERELSKRSVSFALMDNGLRYILYLSNRQLEIDNTYLLSGAKKEIVKIKNTQQKRIKFSTT